MNLNNVMKSETLRPQTAQLQKCPNLIKLSFSCKVQLLVPCVIDPLNLLNATDLSFRSQIALKIEITKITDEFINDVWIIKFQRAINIKFCNF